MRGQKVENEIKIYLRQYRRVKVRGMGEGGSGIVCEIWKRSENYICDFPIKLLNICFSLSFFESEG